MKVATRAPQCRIRFVTHKLGEFTAEVLQDSRIDVMLRRRIGQAAGAFQIVMVPRTVGFTEGFEDVLQPMDFVSVELWVPPRPELVVFRGFVDSVVSQFSIGGGTPQRTVILAGRDYGKLALITKAYSIEAVSARFGLFARWLEGFRKVYGRGRNTDYRPEWSARREPVPEVALRPKGETPGDVLESIVKGFLEPQEAAVRAGFVDVAVPSLRFVNQVEAKDDEVLRAVNPVLYAMKRDPMTDIWTMLRAYQHAPWRELFFDDFPDFPALIYRPTPWLDREGQFIQTPAAGVDPWPLTREDLIEFSLARSDEEVRNYFFTLPGLLEALPAMVREHPTLHGFMLEPLRGNPFLVGAITASVEQPGPAPGEPPLIRREVVAGPLEESDYRRHGFRPLEVRTPYFDIERHVSEPVLKAQLAKRAEPAREENLKLVRALDHGALLEHGGITIRGDERIHVGDYVDVQDARYYVEGLTHRYRQGTQPQDGHFVTALEVARGRGHLARQDGKRGPL